MSPKAFWMMLVKIYHDWSDDKASRLAAALAFYTILSLAPVLVIITTFAGFAFGQLAVRDEIVNTIHSLMGRDGAEAIEMVLENAAMPGHNTLFEVVGIVILLYGAAEVFIQLKDSLNDVWNVMPRHDRGIFGTIREYFFSLSMIAGIGFLLLVSLVVNAALSAFGTFIDAHLLDNEIFLSAVNFTISFIIITFLFAIIYKVVPDAQIAWSDVWIGAAVTAILFIAGKFLIGFYLGYSTEGSSYGAAGSLVILMIWVYYSAQIFLMGAEFTKVYAERFGSKIKPEDNAIDALEL